MQLRRAIMFVKDFDVMRRFYGATLGLTEIPASEEAGWIEFDAGGASVALHAIPPAIAAGVSLASPVEPREDSPTKLVFVVDDVGAERSRLIKRGVTMFETQSWGACDGLDPEGNVFQIAGK